MIQSSSTGSYYVLYWEYVIEVDFATIFAASYIK